MISLVRVNFVESGEIPEVSSRRVFYRKSDNSVHAFNDNLSDAFFDLDCVVNCERLFLTNCVCYYCYSRISAFPNLVELVLKNSHLDETIMQYIAPRLQIVKNDFSSGIFFSSGNTFPNLVEYHGVDCYISSVFRSAFRFPKLLKFVTDSKPHPWKSDGTPATLSWVAINSVQFYHKLMVSARICAILCLKHWKFPKDVIKLIYRQISIDWFFEKTTECDRYLDELAGISYSDFKNLEPIYQKLHSSESMFKAQMIDIQARRQEIRKVRRINRAPLKRSLERMEDRLAEIEAVAEASRAFIKTYLKKRKLKTIN